MEHTIKLSGVANGAVDERFNIEMNRVLENIKDLNTDPLKKRKIVLEIVIEPNEQRTLGTVAVTAKTTLAPAKDVTTTLIIDTDHEGKARAAELQSGIPGQTFISNDGEILTDKGEPVEVYEDQTGNNVVRFKG